MDFSLFLFFGKVMELHELAWAMIGYSTCLGTCQAWIGLSLFFYYFFRTPGVFFLAQRKELLGRGHCVLQHVNRLACSLYSD
jgi:hypothetical protein